jgi:hypothetical protein
MDPSDWSRLFDQHELVEVSGFDTEAFTPFF